MDRGASPRMMRFGQSMLAAVAGCGLILVSLGAPTTAQTNQVLSCPEMTDSITRVHRALFGEDPPPAVKQNWSAAYQAGDMNLYEIGRRLATSERYETVGGPLSGPQFLNQVYRNTIDEMPDIETKEHWYDALRHSDSRGQLAVVMAEREEFVETTGTAMPLAGFQKAYPNGVRWYCGTGSADVSIIPLQGTVFYDYYVSNEGDPNSPLPMASVQISVSSGTRAGDASSPVELEVGAVQAGHEMLRWNQRQDWNDEPGRTLRVVTSPTVRWAVVFYPTSITSARPGWEIESG